MTNVLWAGMFVSTILGIFHAIYVYQLVTAGAPAGGAVIHGRGIYYAMWTLGLWILFGAYVLVLWVVAVVAYAIARPFQWRM